MKKDGGRPRPRANSAHFAQWKMREGEPDAFVALGVFSSLSIEAAEAVVAYGYPGLPKMSARLFFQITLPVSLSRAGRKVMSKILAMNNRAYTPFFPYDNT